MKVKCGVWRVIFFDANVILMDLTLGFGDQILVDVHKELCG